MLILHIPDDINLLCSSSEQMQAWSSSAPANRKAMQLHLSYRKGFFLAWAHCHTNTATSLVLTSEISSVSSCLHRIHCVNTHTAVSQKGCQDFVQRLLSFLSWLPSRHIGETRELITLLSSDKYIRATSPLAEFQPRIAAYISRDWYLDLLFHFFSFLR